MLLIEYYKFGQGDFRHELMPLISKKTRSFTYDQNLNLYCLLAKTVGSDLLIPGNYSDITESYSIIIQPNGTTKRSIRMNLMNMI